MRTERDSAKPADGPGDLRSLVRVSFMISAVATSASIVIELLGPVGGGWQGLAMSCAISAALGIFAFSYRGGSRDRGASETAGWRSSKVGQKS